MESYKFYILVITSIFISSCNSNQVIYNKAFLSSNNWVIEQQPGGKVEFNKNTIEITDANGCTIWFKYELKAPIKIEYDAIVIDEGGQFDRVSDLNCFWMSKDPKSPNDFFKNSNEREGKFNNYHELLQYYVGYGGHDNTKTRFRRYNGEMNRPLLPEHDLSDYSYMIIPNTKIHITLSVQNNKVTYMRNSEIIFELKDQDPYLRGYFGIRTVNNHMRISDLKITQL